MPLLNQSPRSKKNKRFGVVPKHRAHDVEASDCVFELFERRTALRPAVKNSLPRFVSKTPGYTPFYQLAQKILGKSDISPNKQKGKMYQFESGLCIYLFLHTVQCRR